MSPSDFSLDELAVRRGDATGHARISIRRRVDWMDTDAAGIYHWTTALRMAEAAEAALHTALGISDRTFGRTPRLRVGCDFRTPARFNELLDIELEVTEIGRTSLTQRFRLLRRDVVIAEGLVTICFCEPIGGRPTPWPDDIRALFETAGLQPEQIDT